MKLCAKYQMNLSELLRELVKKYLKSEDMYK